MCMTSAAGRIRPSDSSKGMEGEVGGKSLEDEHQEAAAVESATEEILRPGQGG